MDRTDGDSINERAGGLWRDLRTVAALMTRLPRAGERPPDAALFVAARAFTLIGAGLGLAAGATCVVALGLGLPAPAAALIAIAVGAGITGARHEAGLAALAEGLADPGGPEDRIKRMAAPRVGAAGVTSLILSVGLRATAVAAIDEPLAAAAALIAAAAGSFGVLPLVMTRFDAVGNDLAGRPAGDAAMVAATLGALFVLLFLGPIGGVIAVLTAGGLVWALALLARKRLGGITGAVLGAMQQTAEAAILLTAAAMI